MLRFGTPFGDCIAAKGHEVLSGMMANEWEYSSSKELREPWAGKKEIWVSSLFPYLKNGDTLYVLLTL